MIRKKASRVEKSQKLHSPKLVDVQNCRKASLIVVDSDQFIFIEYE